MLPFAFSLQPIRFLLTLPVLYTPLTLATQYTDLFFAPPLFLVSRARCPAPVSFTTTACVRLPATRDVYTVAAGPILLFQFSQT